MSDQILINAERAAEFVQRRHNPEQDEGQVTWSESALADALSDAIQEIRKLRKEVDDLKPWQRMVEQIEELWDKGLNSEGADFNENGWFFGFYGCDKVSGRWIGGRGQGSSLPEAVEGAYRQVKEGGLR